MSVTYDSWLNNHKNQTIEEIAKNGELDFFSGEYALLSVMQDEAAVESMTSPGKSAGVAIADTNFVPVALVQDVTLQQGKQMIPVSEVGSTDFYTFPGRVQGSLSVARILYSGASLLNVFSRKNTGITNDYASGQGDTQNFYSNLASKLFDRPVHILLTMYLKKFDEASDKGKGVATGSTSSTNDGIGLLFENALIPSHNFGVNAGGLMIQEAVTITYKRIIPVSVH